MSDPITVNITRAKTNIAIARLKDVQFPTGGDFNFYVKPAPLTDAMKKAITQMEPTDDMKFQAMDAGISPEQVPAPQQVAQKVAAQNINNAPQMERKLRQRMIDASYGTEARQSIEDLGIKGSAVVKGPYLENRKYVRYKAAETSEGELIQVPVEVWEPIPTVKRVAPENFFPDPSARRGCEIEDAFEVHTLSFTEVAALASNPAFIDDLIKDVLETKPDETTLPSIFQDT